MALNLFYDFVTLAYQAPPRIRRLLWRTHFDVLSAVWRDRDWRFMNYGFQPETPFPLAPDDEPEREYIGLYHQAVEGLPVAGARVLEVGSGRGGGARYIARYHHPASMVGVDLSPRTVARASKLNSDTPNLTYQVGDAERLPFADGAFDIVVNIESSHCYGDVEAFAKEVARVLAPGGWFTFADMRDLIGDLPRMDRELAVPGLRLVEAQDISAGVVAAIDASEARKRERIGRMVVLRRFMSEFAGASGSTLYQQLVSGELVYAARRYRKIEGALAEPVSGPI